MQSSADRLACDVCRPIPLSEPAGQILDNSLSALDFLTRLRDARLYVDALRVAAHAFPVPQAIWWGSLCAWEFYRPDAGADATPALEVVVHWLQEPGEQLRRDAEKAARRAGLASPAGALSMAVFVSGGSISLPGLPAVAPDPLLAPKLVAHAVLAASQQPHPTAMTMRQQEFLEVAANVARAGVPWKSNGVQPGSANRSGVKHG
jgi:hypothetical protein